MKKILFIAPHRPGRSPSQRFRFEQYFDFLESEGYSCKLSYLVSKNDDQYLYNPGHYGRKALLLLKNYLTRSSDFFDALNSDIIFIQREAFFTGSTFFEWLFRKSGAKIIFDFDDSIWLPDVSSANRHFAWLKDSRKTAKIIRLADMVFAGNTFLANYAQQFNSMVKIIPTTIDTDRYNSFKTEFRETPVCIGWSGSITTIKHFELAVPVLRSIKEKFGNKVCFKVIGDSTYANKELNISGLPWNGEHEIKELSTFDIGIMPLPDDEWSKGKCGLKGLQYMSLKIPAVMSPVGVNTEIITHGIDGFLAASESEWMETLSQLIASSALRKQLGEGGRKKVEEFYSFNAQKHNYLNSFNELTS